MKTKYIIKFYQSGFSKSQMKVREQELQKKFEQIFDVDSFIIISFPADENDINIITTSDLIAE